ncbi:HAD-superfamily hydrolase subfamily IA, variant 3 [Shewanella denitrificans OS217]|uniref:HAD-superfamily hydrolase subfamily IA, variant 3 n=1 Tax=Shewanella denitrificans (strain OS217 / ATCC BAA-1090 / DSM 15013) TaxID=318161 RepID=Q12SQ7_SHEDO|nr:GMP/IMP nucleotidase [Shewanella denitrificans]ABE53519.1 HAD-superfamily hydrolase subfamily IA, variant 3 [Shewanella denitrificans OS217]
MFDWNTIDTVLLDMDGTLLDLHFDTHFWLTLVPQQLSQQRNIHLHAAKTLVEQAYKKVQGTLEWYCLDYWQQALGLDILTLHYSIAERIQLRQDSMPFLQALGAANKKRILFTNAHPKSLSLKLEHTELASGLDAILSSHETGYPKEHPEFWRHGLAKFNLDPARCLFIDDSEVILAASRRAGIGHQLGIMNPDSKKPNKRFSDFPAIDDYHLLLMDSRSTPLS